MSKEKSPTPPDKKAKAARWRRRTIWTLSVLIVLGFFLRAVLPLALPTVMRKVAGVFGLTCNYDRLELNLFSGDAGIWGLEFKPKEGGDAILTADYCHGNVSVLNLFKGKLNVWRVEADGVDINVDRNADGHIPLLDRFVAATSKTATTPAPATTSSAASDKPVDLASPLRVDALRLSHIRVHIHDRGVTPEVDAELAMDLRLSDLGSTSQPAKFEMNFSADPFLDSMKVTGEGKSGGKNLDASLNVLVRGIRLKPVSAYLAPLGIRPVSDGITLHASGSVHTAAAPNNAEGFTGSIALDHLLAQADRQEALALDSVKVDTGVIDTKTIRFNSIVAQGARASAGRAADGNLQIAGIEYDPALVAKKAAEAPTAASPTPPLLLSLMAERWNVGEVALRDARLDLHDQGIVPQVDLAFIVDDLSAKSIDYDPKNLNNVVSLSGAMRAPGLVQQIKLDGSATPFADSKHFAVSLDATGIKPDAIKPYLDQAGLESTLKSGEFTAGVDATMSIGDTITANAKVTKFDFHDGDAPLLALNSAAVSGFALEPRTARVSVADIELSGPGISVLRDRDGELAALGVKTKPRENSSTATQAAGRGEGDASVVAVSSDQNHPQPNPLPEYRERGPEQPATTFASLPRITIGRFGWKDIRFDIEDQSVNPPVKVSVSDVGVEANDISTDLGQKKAGHFKAYLESPAVAKSLALEGDVTPGATGLKVDAMLNGSGMDTTAFASYLKPLGIEPVLHDGAVRFHTAASIDQTDAGISASMGIDHLSYTAGAESLASVESLQIKGIALAQGQLGVDAIEISKPHAAARREADGSLVAGGIRILPPAPADPNAVPAKYQPMPTPAAGVAPAVATGAATSQPASAFVVKLKKLSITDAGVDWADAAVQPAVSTSAGTSLELDNLVLGRDADPAAFNLTASVAGSVDHFAVTGKVSAGPSKQAATLDVAGTGIRLGGLASYLPPGIGSSLKDGRFRTTVDAAVTKNPAGGIGAQLLVGPVTYQDGADGGSLFSLDSVRVIVPRIDLPLNALAVDEMSINGVQTHAERNTDGTLSCMGLLLGEKSGAAATAVPATAPAVAAATEPAVPIAAASAVPTTGPSVQQLIAASHRVLPAVTVEKLDLNASHLAFTDLSRPESAPLVVSNLRLHNVNRIDWLGKDPGSKPATHLNFLCKISPLLEQVNVDALVTPFARQPGLVVDFAATGVHGDGLTKLIPELKKQIDGSGMDNGSASGHFEAEAKLDRQSPLDFDVSKGFDLSFDLSKVQYRAQPDGPVLAGVDEVKSEKIRIVPADSIVHFKMLEIDKPIGLITQDDKGVHALGWVYKLSTTQPAAGSATPSTQPALAAAPAGEGAAATTVPTGEPTGEPVASAAEVKPRGEVRIDKLLIDGLDFRVEDSAVTPPMVIPLNGLDVEVKNISTLSPYEDKPIRFSALVNADKVKLRKRGATTRELEDRDLFSQITANGEVSLYPQLHGWAKTSVSGLDLAALQGPAKQFGENLTAGVYDSSVDLRFDPTGAVAITSKFVLTDLSLSEPPNGLIFRTLNLPAPLDAAIGAVQGADGSIALPLNVSLDPKHISYADLGLAAAGGVSQVLVTAIAAAPLKAANDVSGLIGLGGGDKAPENLTTLVSFAPGSSAVGAQQYSQLVPLLKKLHDDQSLTVTIKHTLGMGDIRLSSVRANPSPEQCRNLEAQLRLRKAELLQLRADAAGQARAQLVSLGAESAAAALQHVRAIDRELAGVEESLDQMGDLLRPGAAKLAERRTRSAALQIANDRSASIQSVILAQGISADRVKTVNAQFNPADELDGGQVVITAVHTR
jgi:hypothetical protein